MYSVQHLTNRGNINDLREEYTCICHQSPFMPPEVSNNNKTKTKKYIFPLFITRKR